MATAKVKKQVITVITPSIHVLKVRIRALTGSKLIIANFSGLSKYYRGSGCCVQ